MTAFVVAAITFSQIFDSFFSQVQAAVSANTGWFLIFSMNAILIFCVYLAASRFSHIRLGGPDATPEFSTAGWLAMLFAAGMGIGLVFYSVAEPLQHFASFEPYMENHPAQAATLAMRMTFLHWGFHPWAVYSLVGLALAYFHFNRHHPLTFAAPFEDLAGRSIGWKGHAINILAVLATAFGVATSLGLGVAQANAGLDYLLGIGQGLFIQFIVLALVMAVSIVSIARGLDEGVRWLSEINLVGALLLLLFILLLGPTVFILKALGENIGGYLNEILVLSTWNETYTGTNWQDKWTIFYWGWWISWSPFVGLFIARVSRGRTVRDFLTGVMLVPATFNFFWIFSFSVTANS
jgi:choline/glycine/proline betaine transport protein